MALVVLLRGVNVGGHRAFRPSLLARSLRRFDVVSIGAAGTFVVRQPGPRRQFRAALVRKLPADTQIVFCEGRDLLRLEGDDPFALEPASPGVVRFVSVLMKSARLEPALPIRLPATGDWLVRIIASRGRLVFGEYRRHMKTIGHLGQLDKLFGAPATTRNWNTIRTILGVLRTAAETSATTSLSSE